MAPRETELTNPAVVRRLQAAGLDPEKAREVAITHGLKPSEVDYGIMSRWWNQLSGTKLKPDEGYERARAELLHVASMNDFGVTFAQSLPPEALGEAVHKAVWGRYDTLNGARKMAMQTLDDKLPEGLKLDMTSFKRSLGIHPPVKMGGVMIRPPSSKAATRHPAYDLAYSLPDQASFSDVENTRTAIATMLRDQRTKKSPSELADIEGLLKQFDDHTAKALPPGYKNDYRKFARADNNRNKDLLDGAFVSGLLQHKPTMRKFADEIIGNTDIDSFRQLEKVVATQPEANRTIASLKSSIAERFMSKAAPNGIIEPNKLLTGLGSQTEGYGKAFIDTVLGPQYSKNYIRFAKTMDEVNTAASKAGQTIRGVSTVAGVAAGVQGLFRGAPGMSGHMAAVIGTALFSPVVLERMLTSPQGAKLLMKTAENVATGRSPMTTARLAGRVLEQAGYAPEDFAKALSPGMALLEPPLQSLRQPGLPGSAKAPFGIRRDPAVPIGQTQAPLRERADYEIGQTLGSSDEGMQ